MINPDLPPPRFLMDKLSEASIKPDNHRYAVSRGVRKLREGFSVKYRNRFGVALDPEAEICVTMGTKDAVLHTLMTCAKAGDLALIGIPSYPAHLSALGILGLRSEFFEIGTDQDQMLGQIAAKFQEQPVKFLLLNFPNNPTGVSVNREFYEKLYGLAVKHGVLVINDFVYGEMPVSTETPISMLSVEGFESTAVESYSLSKAYSVPGWRVGALLGNTEVVQRLSRLKSHIDYGVFLPLQLAAAAALSAQNDLTAGIASQYRQRAHFVMKGLYRLGWQPAMPTAGCSIWARIPEKFGAVSAIEFCRRVLSEKGILLTPGSIFGDGFDQYVRFALVLPEDRLHRCLGALGEFNMTVDAHGAMARAVDSTGAVAPGAI
jgi:alanine-synthesizing transaminase